MATSQDFVNWVCSDRIDYNFLKYVLLAEHDAFLRFASGTTHQTIYFPEVKAFHVCLPPRDEQRDIARILGALDDKIELNRQLNETLEAMARALFKSWFVDFDPVRAKVEGSDTQIVSKIRNLFPDSFELSTIGDIPVGWRDTVWGELVTLEYGKSLSGYSGGKSTYPVFGTNGQIGTYSHPLCDHAGIIVGRKGAYRGIHFCNMPFFAIDTAFYVEPRGPMEMRWAYYELLRNDINSMDSGSAIPSTSREDFYSIPVVAPPFEIQQAFARILEPHWLRQDSSQRQSQTLTALRDTLLPKLISGELRVKTAEKIVEAVA
jgi:type I restriction enzyme S subunit